MKMVSKLTLVTLALVTTSTALAQRTQGSRTREVVREGAVGTPGAAAGQGGAAAGARTLLEGVREGNTGRRAQQQEQAAAQAQRQAEAGRAGAGATEQQRQQQQQANAGGAQTSNAIDQAAVTSLRTNLSGNDVTLLDKLTTLANGTSSASNGAKEALRTAVQNGNFNHLSAEKRQQIIDCI